jgi:hypothetical protein
MEQESKKMDDDIMPQVISTDGAELVVRIVRSLESPNSLPQMVEPDTNEK